MTTVEKRRSSRKSHRKRNDGGYSDTETDREVSSLTDRAFRSLCIGDEAVYNDSDLSASPCTQRDRQLALSHNVQDREELKRTAHESFSLRVQQYGQDWNYRGTYGAAIHKDQQWGMCGERGTQGRLSATFQQSFVEAPQQECPSREYSNGTAEVHSQPRRSHSQVSSLIQAFNSEGQRDEAVYNNETSWDKSALMSIERELSEFSSYPQNMNTGYFPSPGLFSSQNYYSSEVAAISQMNSASSFMRSSHSMSTQVNCNSNFFIHSEFSPFKVWRDHNRFPFHRGQVSGFVPCSEFQKWYETPMYKELSLQPQQHPSMFSDQGYHRNTFAPAVPMNPQRSTSASSMMQRAAAVEKRCESTGHYRKRAQSTGANRLPSQRPSTASPSSEMSRQVRDTISSVKSLQQKIKMMTEQNLETQSQGGFCSSNYLSPYGPMIPNMVSSNPYTAPYQMQKSPIYAPQEPQQFFQPDSVSPQPVEHAPVRAESRGATPDIKMSSYKSKAASLLYNLKDNRKRVKATYSPSKFKSMDTPEKYKQEPNDFVIDVPEYPGNELLISTEGKGNRIEVGQYGHRAHSPRLQQNSQYPQNCHPEFQNPPDRNRLNIPQYGYQAQSAGMLQYPQHAQYSQHEFVNPADKTIRLNVPQYGYQAHSPGMLRNSQHMENSQHKLMNPTEDRGNRSDGGPYGYQAHSPRIQQNIQFPQNSQNMLNSQQLYPGQNSSEYYRAQMQGEVAPHHGFTGYTPEYYANNRLANGQNPYENISSFTPYKQGVSDTGEGNYVNRLGQNAAAEMQRFGAVGQTRDCVFKDNRKQQFNEAASGEFVGVDRYNQLKENKYDYNNVYSQDMWGQTNSQETQRPGIPLAQNYQNINAYQRTNAQNNVQSYNYEQKFIENYGARTLATVTATVAVSHQGPQYPPSHSANAGNSGYSHHNTQQPPATYRDIYAPPMSHEFNKENKMKENYAPQDNHKYYDQESKKQTIISSQEGVPIAMEELSQRKETAIKEYGMKGMQLNETRHFDGQHGENLEQEQVEKMSTREQCTNGQVSLQHNVHKNELNEIIIAEERQQLPHKDNNIFAKHRSVQERDLPTAEDQIKQLREEKSNSDPVEPQEMTDEQEHVVETEIQRPDTGQQLIVQHANTEELKEEPIKCELAAGSKEARIEQVKPEPGRKEGVITDQANETQMGAEHVERKTEKESPTEERSEPKQPVTVHKMKNDANTKSGENKEVEVMAINDEKSITEVQNSKQNEVTNVDIINERTMSEERRKNTEKAQTDVTNVNYVQENLSKSEPKQPVKYEPDKVEQAKTELAKTKAELAKIKEKMKGDMKVHKDEENIVQENDNPLLSPKEPPMTNLGLESADRGADDYEHIRKKYGYNQAANKNKTSITDKVSEQSTLPNADKKEEIAENKVDSNLDSRKASTNSEVISDTTEGNEKTKNALYDDPTESQYVYSESSKDFKLSVASNVDDHEDRKGVPENVVKQDAFMEKEEKSDVSQQRNPPKQMLVDECKLSKSKIAESADKETIVKIDASQVKNVPVGKVGKLDLSQQKDPAKQAVVQKKQKPSDQSTGTGKETSVKCVAHKDKAQTKQDILTSKIKAHAEKEISAIKEGFAIRDGFKNSTKPLAMSQNVSIRQKPPSQEAYKKQERVPNSDTSKVQTPVAKTGTVTSQPAELSQKQAKNNEPTTEKEATSTNTSNTTSIKITEKSSIPCNIQNITCSAPTDGKTSKTAHQKKHLKQDNSDKGDLAEPEKTAPSLQLVFDQNKSSAEDDSLNIMGIIVTVRERKPSESNERENKRIEEILSVKCINTEKQGTDSTGVEINSNRLSEKAIACLVKDGQDYDKTKDITSETDSMTLGSTEKNLIDCVTEKTLQQESSVPIDRPQSETQLSNHMAEKVEPLTVTVPDKNKVLAVTQPVPNKQDIIAEETKDYTNRTPNAVPDTTGTKGQEEISEIRTRHDLQPTIEINREISVPTTSNEEKTQEDSLHIDSIAIRVVPAVTEEVMTTGGSVKAKESKEITNISSNHHQDSSPSNEDVQKVLSSVRKQAQLLKSSNQQTINSTISANIENDQSKQVNTILEEATKSPIEEGYFQVEKRNNEPEKNSISIGQTSTIVSQAGELPHSLSNSDTVSNKSLKEEGHTEMNTLTSANMQYLNAKTSKQIVNPSNDKSNKDEKPGAGPSHLTRRHQTAKDRQRGLRYTQDGSDSKVEVKPKPKVPIPEISALADYARLKVIVSQDNEDHLQQLPPNKKEGFFPLIQTRHSRRPVFTVDSQEDSVKEKASQNPSDASIKVSKEPKPFVFSITEKEHHRTGLFKLGDKETKEVKDNNNTGQQTKQENSMEQTPQDKTNNDKKIQHILEKSKATQAEEQKKATQREEEQRAREREAIAAQIRERRKKQREVEGLEEKRKNIVVEQQLYPELKVKDNKLLDEQQQISEQYESQKKTEIVEKNLVDEHKRASLKEEQRRSMQEKQQRKAYQEDPQNAPIKEEQFTGEIVEKQQAAEEQKKKDISEDHQRQSAKIEEPKKRLLLEEQQRRAALEQQQKKVTQTEEDERKTVKEEQLKKAVQEDQTRKINEEHLRKAEEQNRAILEEKQRKAAQIREQRRKFQEQQERATQEEQLRKMAEEQKKAAVIEDQKKRAAFEQHRKTAAEEQLKKSALIEEQKRKSMVDEHQRKAGLTEEQRRQTDHDEHLRETEEQQQWSTLKDQHKKAAQEEHKKKAALEELDRRAAQKEQQRKMVEEEQQRKAAMIEEQKKRSALEEQQRKATAEEQLRRAALIEEQKQKSAADEQRKATLKEEQRRASLEEQQRKKKMDEEEQQRKAAEEQQKQPALTEKQRRQAAHEEQQRKMAEEEQKRKAAIIDEQKKRAALEEQQRKAALIEEQRRAALEEHQRKKKIMEEEQQRKAAIEEEQRKAVEEQQRKAALIEEKRRQAAQEEQLRKMAEEELQRQAVMIEEQKKRAALEEQQRKAALKEEQRRAALEEHQRKKKIMEEEQQRKAAIEEEQRKAVEEQQRKAALIEEKRRQAAQEEQLRKMAEEELQRQAVMIKEQKKRAALEEQQRKAALKEEQRRAALEEQQRKKRIEEEEKQRNAATEEEKRKAVEEQQRKAALIEEKRRQAAHEEQLRKMAEEEQQRQAVIIDEQKKRAALEELRKKKMLEEEQQRKAALEEEKRKAIEEQQKAAIIEENRRQAAHEEQLRKMAEEEQQRKAVIAEEQKKRVLIKEQQRRLALEEQQRKVAQEKQNQKAALVEQQTAAQKKQQTITSDEEQQRKAIIFDDQKKKVALEEQQRKDAVAEEQKRRAALEEEKERRTEVEEQYRKAVIEEQKRKDSQIEKQKRSRQDEDEKCLAFIREERIRRQIEEAQMEQERQQQNQLKTEQSLGEVRPQINTQKIQGKEIIMHNEGQIQTVKDNRVFREQYTPQKEMDIRARRADNQEGGAETEEPKIISEKTDALQYYSLTSAEGEKPSPPQKRNNANGPETAEDYSRPLAPVSPAPSLSRSTTASPAFGYKPSMFKVKDNTGRGSSLTKSIKPRFHKNFGEEFRVGSPMEREKNESDQVILRYNAGTPVYPEKSPSTPLPEQRPFSRRSLALDEEDCRSVISNMSDVESFATSAADLADIRALYDSDRPESACSFSSDVSRSLGKPPAVPPKSEKALRRAKRLATRRIKKDLNKGQSEDSCEASMSEAANDDSVASPHFAPPISIAHAPPAGSSVSSPHSHHHSFQATPHATAPVSLPTASPHTSAPVSVPSSQHAGSFSTSASPKSIPQGSSSPTLQHAPKPVTQYQVESGFSQSYTQRRVMQDVGSGQYYVVDVPVEVKTKTFFDPETGKYVQLNVRESNRNATQRQPLQAYPQPHLKPKIQAKPQSTPSANAHYQGYHSYPKGYQPAATSSAPVYQSLTPETLIQDKQPVRSSLTHQHRGAETDYSYSPDKTPYMDTVNNADKARNVVYSTHGSQRTQSEGKGHSSTSRRGSRDIITMSELEDFMEVSDW